MDQAFSYYLTKSLPKGAVLGVINPTPTIQRLLPDIAKERNCRISCFNAPASFVSLLAQKKLLTKELPELFIIEPPAYTETGALLNPDDITHITAPIFALAPTASKITHKPAELDFQPISKLITEKGTTSFS